MQLSNIKLRYCELLFIIASVLWIQLFVSFSRHSYALFFLQTALVYSALLIASITYILDKEDGDKASIRNSFLGLGAILSIGLSFLWQKDAEDLLVIAQSTENVLWWTALIVLSTCVFWTLSKPIDRTEDIKLMPKRMTILYICLSIFLTIIIGLCMVTQHSTYSDIYNVNTSIYLFNLVLNLVITTIVLSKLRNNEDNHVSKASAAVKDKEDINKRQLKGLMQRFEACMDKEQLFLRADLSLADLSTETGIAEYKLSTMFKYAYKKNFYQLIAEYRINYARELMKKEEHLTYEAIAEKSGFNSLSTFYKYFKARFHCTPDDYEADEVVKEETVHSGQHIHIPSTSH